MPNFWICCPGDLKMGALWHHSPALPSGYVKIAIENGHRKIVDLPIKNCDFP